LALSANIVPAFTFISARISAHTNVANWRSNQG